MTKLSTQWHQQLERKVMSDPELSWGVKSQFDELAMFLSINFKLITDDQVKHC